ncbi:MAG: MerR family transcriptional regulator [Syntrophobacterales bacterium]|nr:MAG: MerR family transcriptional regulator [Syntrophobacterales bacterium]
MKVSDSEPIYTIGIAAKKLGISVPALRVYEKEGLIVPLRTSTNRRLYSLNDLRIIETIRNLIQRDGLNFVGLRRMLSFLPCWKIKRCNPASFDKCEVPRIADRPCWSSGKSASRQCEDDCQSCPVYAHACHVDDLSVYDLIEGQNFT